MSPIVLPILLVAVSVASATAGWTFRDARARGLPMRKALTWAVISTQEFPVDLPPVPSHPPMSDPRRGTDAES
jgi:hypothetical protein